MTRQETILVVDFGAQYAQLIARRVREAGVYSEIVSHDIPAAELASRQPRGIILSGGPKSVYAEHAPRLDPDVYALDVPILGICYGAQLLAHELGGSVERTGRGEYGRAVLKICQTAQPSAREALAAAPSSPPAKQLINQSAAIQPTRHESLPADPKTPIQTPSLLLANLPDTQDVWMSHFDAIAFAPDGCSVTATTADSPVAAFEDVKRGLYGVQFHPEVAHTAHGQAIMERFVREACGTDGNWTPASIAEESVAAIAAQVGEDGRAICGLSGGVDSSVAAALAHRALGDRLTCVFVDTGLLRKGEADQVVETFGRNMGMELVHVDASDKFFERLRGVSDPEQKRSIIGELFIRTFEEAAAKISGGGSASVNAAGSASRNASSTASDTGISANDTSSTASDAEFLVQGTLYPDVIESGTGHAAKIKSHHNVGGLPEDLEFELVEPLVRLFKDEVRQVGKALGLPEEIVQRQPFPGPGLAVRVIGEVTHEAVALLQEADAIVREEIMAYSSAGSAASPENEIWQYFAVLPDVRTVGVMGDERTYAHLIVIRAVTSEDAMTADWARLPPEVLATMSSRIINEVPQVNRVAYDITSKPPGTIEWE